MQQFKLLVIHHLSNASGDQSQYSTHPQRVRLSYKRYNGSVYEFQSTHPQRVRRSMPLTQTPVVVFQSTHPQRVRPSPEANSRTYRRVSIHAPTKGATKYLLNIVFHYHCFNPRTHKGCDRKPILA